MFKLKVDEEIDLTLVHESFCSKYVDLAKENYEYLANWLSWPPHVKTRDDFLKFVQKCLHDYADGKSIMCGIFYHGELVGNICYSNIDWNLKKVEIGYWLASSHQGKGIVTRSCQKLIRVAFDDMGMHKVQMNVAENNLPGRSVCERLRMTIEGIVTNAEYLNDRIVSHAIYGLHKGET